MHDSESHETLLKSVARFRSALFVVVVLVLVTYTVWFYRQNGLPLSNDPGSWGQFGDFVGGLLNPLIAYAAFHWVTKSVLIQGKELAETRSALRDAAQAQLDQAKHTRLSIQVSALRSIIDAATSNIEFARRELEYVATQLHERPVPTYMLGVEPITTTPQVLTLDGQRLERSSVSEYMTRKSTHISNLSAARDKLLGEMKTLLVGIRGSEIEA
jgi:hypothetical protein